MDYNTRADRARLVELAKFLDINKLLFLLGRASFSASLEGFLANLAHELEESVFDAETSFRADRDRLITNSKTAI